MCAAILHDVVEDCDVSLDTLRSFQSEKTVELVGVLTHIPGESNEIYWQRIKENPLARRIKICDIYDNTDPVRMNKLEPAVCNRLREKYFKALKVLMP